MFFTSIIFKTNLLSARSVIDIDKSVKDGLKKAVGVTVLSASLDSKVRIMLSSRNSFGLTEILEFGLIIAGLVVFHIEKLFDLIGNRTFAKKDNVFFCLVKQHCK